jgi:3',5'-cyclic AMP phosphodiesterase CpdA
VWTAENGPITFTLAHLSDLHVTPIRVRNPFELANKRALGWLSWRRRRRHEHREEILEALLADLEAMAPDHVAVTGDLTNVGLTSEIAEAVPWLERLGGPSHVSIIPGNHDAYSAPVEPRRFAAWAPYLVDVGGAEAGGSGGGGASLGTFGFPTVRRAQRMALVGLCSACPTAPGLATGRLGAEQLARLEVRLRELGEADLCRIVLVHHPPVAAGQTRRRQLDDGAELRAVLGRSGAELILHGHTHRTSFESVDGPRGPIPTVGVPSSSSQSAKAERRARYHLYRVEPREGRFELTCRVRVLEPGHARFVDGPEHSL